jgi:hypothetical protein
MEKIIMASNFHKFAGTALAFLLMAPIANADFVYIPYFAKQEINDGVKAIDVDVQVTMTNTTKFKAASLATVKYFKVGLGKSLNAFREEKPKTIRIKPGQTALNLRTKEEDRQGFWLALDVPKGVDISAKMIFSKAKNSFDLPVLTPSMALSGINVIQGVRGIGKNSTGKVVLTNLSGLPNECVGIYKKPGGGQDAPFDLASLKPWSSTLVDLPPLSDVAGNRQIDLIVNCEKDYYVMEFETHLTTPEVSASVNLPPKTVSEKFNPFQSCTLSDNTMFHKPKKGNEKKRFNITVPNGVYKKVSLEMDFKFMGYFGQGKGVHSVFWLNRNPVWKNNLVGYVNLVGPGGQKVKNITNLGTGEVKHPKEQPYNGLIQEGGTYHVYYSYDAKEGLITTKMWREGTFNGDVNSDADFTMLQGTTVDEITVENEGFYVVFGHGAAEHGPEKPSYGWEYSNLCVTVE